MSPRREKWGGRRERGWVHGWLRQHRRSNSRRCGTSSQEGRARQIFAQTIEMRHQGFCAWLTRSFV